MTLLGQYRGLRREIYILFFGRIVTNLGAMVWPIMTMILSQKLGMGSSEISYYFVGTSIVTLPAVLIGGKLADRISKKRIIVVCDFASVVCYVLCSILPIGKGIVFLFIAASIFQTLEYPAYDALFADLTATKDRERAYSLEYLGSNLGLVLSPTIAGLLFQNYLWLCFLISGVSIAISTVLIIVFVRNITPVEDTGEEAEYQVKKEGVGIFRILKENPLLLLYLLCGTLYGAAYGQYNFIMPLDMAAVHGEAGATIFGTVSSLNCLIVVLFTPLITKLFAKMRDTGKMITGRLLVAGGYLIFLLLLGFVPAYYLCMLVFTWGEIFSTVSEGPYVSSRIPASHRGRINGLMSVAYTAVVGGVDLAVGRLYEDAGSTWTWVLILGVTAASAGVAVLLKALDRKANPKLSGAGENPEGPEETLPPAGET
ncbi:MAG: MFS transporter, partial [Clostridia bacterium]|nr:MFS transporter [Clostridia bacterium]